jgi:hypothetical protein
MTFMKLRCEGAYVTGAIRTSLSPKALAMKLTRHGMPTVARADSVVATCNGETWAFNDWQPDGDGWTAWLGFTMGRDDGWTAWLAFTMGCNASAFSQRLAIHGVRHRFECSTPRDADTDDIRNVITFEYRWHGLDSSNASSTVAAVDQFQEQL